MKRECGAVLIETLISFLVLIFIFLALFDLFTLSSTYVNMSQIAREGILAAVGERHFDTSPWASSTCNGDLHTNLQNKELTTQRFLECAGTGAAGDTTCGHYLVHWRIEKTIEALPSLSMAKESLAVTTKCSPPSGGLPALFEVRISGMFKGSSPFFRNSPIAIRQLGIIR